MGKYKTIIDAESRSLNLNLREVYEYRDLFKTLAYREYRSKYAQTSLGMLWGFLKPISTLLVFTLVFGRFIDIGVENYPLFACCGMLPWAYFSSVFTGAGNSLINNASMMKKVYFPRLIVPLSKAVIGLIDFAIVMVLVIALMFYYEIGVSFEIIYFPLFILLCVITSLGIGIWLSALTIKFRDFQQVIPFMIQFLMYLTPVAYPSSFVINNLPDWGVALYYLNPMAGVIEGFRWSLLGSDMSGELFLLSFSVSILLFVSSLFYFKKVEKKFVDIL